MIRTIKLDFNFDLGFSRKPCPCGTPSKEGILPLNIELLSNSIFLKNNILDK
jgi:hypothetical protein